MGKPEGVACLVDSDGEQGVIGEWHPGAGVKRERDHGAANMAGLVPGEIGLSGAVEVETVDPVHDDFRVARIPNDLEADADTDRLPSLE